MHESQSSYFAYELNDILEKTSMSAEDVVSEANKRGLPLSLHTVHYWLQGYFLPRSNSAFQIVAILESIFGISDNRLSDALLQDLSSGSSFVPGGSADSEVVGTFPETAQGTRFSTVADRVIDWEANLIQKAVRDEMVVSADRRSIRYAVTILARVPAVPNPTFVFQIMYDEDDEVGSDFYNLSGMELRKREIFEEEGMPVCAAQFALPDDVVPGDLHKLSYSWDSTTRTPVEKIGERFLPWTLDFYSSSITFEGGIPEDIRYVTRKPVGGQEIEVPNDIPLIRNGNTVSMSKKNFGNIIGHFWASMSQ